MRFAKNLRPGDLTQYGQIVASQVCLVKKLVQLTIAGKYENIYVPKYSIIRLRKSIV